MGGVDAPVDDFWVSVAEGFGLARCGGGVELAWRCGVKWCQGGVNGLFTAGCISKGTECVPLRGDKGVGVYRLPNREQTINVSADSVSRVKAMIANGRILRMMEQKDRVKGRVGHYTLCLPLPTRPWIALCIFSKLLYNPLRSSE